MTAAGVQWAYVGSRTARERGGRGDGITVFRHDPVRGTLEPEQVVGDVLNPSFFAIDRGRDRLFTVHGDGEGVSVFAIEAGGARLRLLQSQTSGGRNPVHVALAPDGRCLVVSNHAGEAGGSIAVLPVAGDGRLGPPSQRIPLSGAPGPHRTEQASSRPHAAVFDPSGRFVLAMDKGHDRVSCFRYAQGDLTPAERPVLDSRPGSGPRAAAFHPRLPVAYLLHDLDSTVSVCAFDTASGALRPLQWLPTLSERFSGPSRAATVTMSPDGAHLYVSNRGEDSVARFAVDAAAGVLRYEGAVPSGGATPRFATLDPAGRWLYALNEAGDSICTFAVEPGSGQLVQVSSMACGSPICMAFSEDAAA